MRYLITASKNTVMIFDFLTEEVDICTPATTPNKHANWSTLPISQVLVPSTGIYVDKYPFLQNCGIDIYNFDAVLNSIRFDFVRSRQFKSLAKLAATARWNVRVTVDMHCDGEYRSPYITTDIQGEEWYIKNRPISYGGTMPLYELDGSVGNVSSREDDILAENCTLVEAIAIMEREPRFIPDDEWLYT